MADLGMTLQTTMAIEDADAAVREALKAEGFGILTEIDVAATLKEKIDVDRAPYRILGACNPVLANKVLEHDESIGLMLPCNVTLSATDEGTQVSIVDPLVMLATASDSAELATFATAAREKLARALDTLR